MSMLDTVRAAVPAAARERLYVIAAAAVTLLASWGVIEVTTVPAWVALAASVVTLAFAILHSTSTLRTALTMARGCGLRRPFHEAGPAVRRLLAREDPGQRVAADGWGSQAPPLGALDGSATHDRPAGAPIEELTAKESEVLGHLAELLTTEEIAAVMFISVNTVRTHVRNILRKFGVPRRNAAVRLAREYELLGR